MWFCRPFGALRYEESDPGAARSALAPGYLLPRPRRWFHRAGHYEVTAFVVASPINCLAKS